MSVLNPILQKFNVNIVGQGEPTLVLAHGFGTDQTTWRYQVAELADQHRIVLFDHLGCGKADISDYNPQHYNTLERFAADVLQIYRALELTNTVFVGHSGGSMIGLLASLVEPANFAKLVFVGASPRYLNEDGYFGGFTRSDLNALYAAMAQNYLGWANGFASLAMANAERPELGQEFARNLATMRPDIAQSTARVIFESDLRAQLSLIQSPVLILQSQRDIAVPLAVGEYLAAHIASSQLKTLNSEGHFPHLSAPAEVTAAIREFVDRGKV